MLFSYKQTNKIFVSLANFIKKNKVSCSILKTTHINLRSYKHAFLPPQHSKREVPGCLQTYGAKLQQITRRVHNQPKTAKPTNKTISKVMKIFCEDA